MTRAVQKAGELFLFQPGLWERYGGYAESGIPALDTIADIVGGLTGAYAQIYMADQLLGPALAAVGRIPQVAKAGQTAGKAISKLPTLAQKFAMRAPYAALKGATVETMRQALYPDEYKPGAAGIARGALMWAGGSIGNTLVEAAMQKAGIVLHPALEAFVEEIGENVGSTIAVAPFVEDKQQLLMELGPDILAEGLYEAVGRLIAGGPVDYESARIYVEMKQDLQEYTANKHVNPEKADAAYKRFWKRINDVFSPVVEATETPKVPKGQIPEQQELGRTLESVPRPAEELPATPSVDMDEQRRPEGRLFPDASWRSVDVDEVLRNTQLVARPQMDIYFRAEPDGELRQYGLIPLTKDPHVATNYGLGGRTIDDLEHERLVRSGRVDEAKSRVKAYIPQVQKTLDLTTDKGFEVLSTLDSTGNEDAEAILRPGTKMYWWINTQSRFQPVWRDIIVPQLEKLGYDSIKYTDAPDTGEVLAVFRRNQLQPIDEGSFDFRLNKLYNESSIVAGKQVARNLDYAVLQPVVEDSDIGAIIRRRRESGTSDETIELIPFKTLEDAIAAYAQELERLNVKDERGVWINSREAGKQPSVIMPIEEFLAKGAAGAQAQTAQQPTQGAQQPRPAEELPATPSVFPESQVKVTVYHGSPTDDIERFITDPEKLGTSTGARDARLGAFFSESPDIATIAAWSFDIKNVFDETRKPTLYEAEINLRHPLNISKISKEELDELERFFPGIKDVVKNADDEYEVVEFIANKTGDPVDLSRMMNFHDYAVSKGITDENVIHTMWRERSGLVPEWKSYNDSLLNAYAESKRAFPAQDILKRLGYDGIIVNTIQDSGDILGKAKQYIVFDPENIAIKRKRNLITGEITELLPPGEATVNNSETSAQPVAEIRQRAEGVSEVWIWPKETGQAQQMVAQAVPQGKAAAELEKRAKTIDFSLKESDDLTLIVVPNAEGQPEIVGAWWRSPVEGVEVFVPNIPEPTDEIRAMLRSQPSYYAAHFAVVRDLFGEPIVRPWRVATTQYQRFTKEYERILYDIFKPFAKKPQARKRITFMLEGELPLEGPESVAAMRMRKEFYGENPESALFKQFGINPDQFHHKYSPWIRQAGDIESAFAGGLPQEYEFFARMHRSGELDPRETDALNIALAYLRQGAKEKFFNPVIERVKPLVDEMHPDRRFIYEQWVNTILGRPALQERLANEAIRKVANLVLKPFGRELKGRPAQAASSFLADLSYQGTMAWTLSAPLKNLTQQSLTIGYLDKKPGQGLKYWAKARVAKHTKTGKELLKYCWVVQDRQYLEGLDAQYQFMQKVMGTSRKYGFFLFRQADIDNVTNAYLGGTLQALDEGKSLAEAVEYGNQVAASTQFLMGIDSPILFKSPLGRMVGIYASWPVNFMRLLWEQGSSVQKHRIASTIVSMIGVAYLMEKLTGLSFKSTRPEEVVKDFLPVKLITGETSSPPVNAASSAIRWLLGAASNADPEFIEAAKNEFIKNMKSFIPGHNAYAAAVRFIEDAVNDWKRYDERGRLMYEITPGEAIRDLIGTTVESEQRQKQHQEIERMKKRYSELRAKAIDAYLDGDIETYREAQAQLRQEFRTMVTLADIQRERQLRQQTSLERHATGLPQTIRQMMGLDTAGIGSAGGLSSFRLGNVMPRSRLSSLGIRSAMPRSRLVTQPRGTSSASGLGSFRLGSVMPRSRLVTQTRVSSMMGR